MSGRTRNSSLGHLARLLTITPRIIDSFLALKPRTERNVLPLRAITSIWLIRILRTMENYNIIMYTLCRAIT